MAETRRRFDEDFKQGAVRIVRETGKPIAQVARELGINEGTLGNWCALDRRRRIRRTQFGDIVGRAEHLAVAGKAHGAPGGRCRGNPLCSDAAAGERPEVAAAAGA